MRAYVGVTDAEWYRFLSARPELREVNFWQPSGGREFHAIAPGEPFFFKTHYPTALNFRDLRLFSGDLTGRW